MNLIIILTLLSQVLTQDFREFVSFDQPPQKVDLSQKWKSRCTRRFAAGTCLEQVKPVWTFEYHIQNCTERLGCRKITRINRFQNYKSCMRRCKYLIDLYAAIILDEGVNETLYHETSVAEHLPSGRRDLEYEQYEQTYTDQQAEYGQFKPLDGAARLEEFGEVNIDYV